MALTQVRRPIEIIGRTDNRKDSNGPDYLYRSSDLGEPRLSGSQCCDKSSRFFRNHKHTQQISPIALSVLVRKVASRLGFVNVKPQQLEAILAFCEGKDVFMSLPSGFRKTLIFAVFPSLFNTI